MHEQSTNHIRLKNMPRYFAKSPTAQDTFWPIPGLIVYAGVTRRWDCYLMHRMQSDGWLFSKGGRDSSKAPSLHAAVLRAAVFFMKIVCNNRNHTCNFSELVYNASNNLNVM